MECKIRIQPGMVEIPEGNPFANDLLDRKTPIEALTNVISNIEGPCVMAVDAPWGMGKTTFIRMWERYLRNQGFPVASFNAWETDYFADPFSALSSELLEELQGSEEKLSGGKEDSKPAVNLEKLKKAIQSVPKKILPVLIRGLSDAAGASLPGAVVAQVVGAYITGDTNDQQNTRKALERFRNTLSETASALAKETGQHPLVVIIDELDRCRPSYAIELLEIAKHFFSVDHIVFVLAINHAELSHSIRAVYGEKFNAENYLERFFDIDFKLPETDKEKFIRLNFQAMKLDQYFQRAADNSVDVDFPAVAKVFSAFFTKADISLRKIAQAMRRLGLVIAALPGDQPLLGWASAIALIVRTIDFELYEKFIRREADDREVIDSILDRPSLAAVRNKHAGNIFEAVIIVAYANLRTNEELQAGMSLYETYQRWADLDPKVSFNNEKGRERAPIILKMVKSLEEGVVSSGGSNFSDAIKRIELFSDDLAQEDAPQN